MEESLFLLLFVFFFPFSGYLFLKERGNVLKGSYGIPFRQFL